MPRILPKFMSLASVLLIALAGMGRADATGYALGPGDVLNVRVVYWDETALAYVPWDGVSGGYSVNGDGDVMLPLAGTVPAADLSIAELATQIGRRLQDSTKLLEPPSVAIDITEYAPIYVLGDVADPGRYEARPGLTVGQALALAGGTMRLETGGADLRGILRDSGTLAQVAREMVRHRVKAARLTAELDRAEGFAVPESLAHPDGAEAMETLLREERAVFDARRRARALEIENLQELKILLGTEISSLESKRSGLETQSRLARENLATVEELRESGLARAIQIREAQRAAFELESQDIDIQNGMFRAQQRIKEADREILAIDNRLITEATSELQQVNATLEELAIRRNVMGELLKITGMDPAMLTGESRLVYHLTRAGSANEEQVPPATPLLRGDMLRVERMVAGLGG